MASLSLRFDWQNYQSTVRNFRRNILVSDEAKVRAMFRYSAPPKV
jgi:hypothetical protein